MKFSKTFLLTASFCFVFVAFSVQADSLRCGGDLALIGDSKGSIFAKCGEPILKDSFCVPVEVSKVVPCVEGKSTTVIVTSCEPVDQWTYNPGSGQFYTTLQFERGMLKSMKFGSRVP